MHLIIFIMFDLAVKAVIAIHTTALDLKGAVVDTAFPQHLLDSFLRFLSLA
jgi:hypothetical protein